MNNDIENSNDNIINRFQRDFDLMWPDFPQKIEDRNFYRKYLNALVDNETFIRASKIAEQMIARAKIKHNRSNKTKQTVLAFLILLLLMGFGVAEYNGIRNYDYAQKPYQHVLLSTAVAALMLFGAGFCWIIYKTHLENDKYDAKPEVFYNRLIVRYFDVLKKMHPELSEKYLQICNQPDMEMARTIYSLLIANMSDADVKKLNAIALSVNWHMRPNRIDTMRDIEDKIKQAIFIIESTLQKHPELQRAVVDAYSCKIPQNFFVVNQSRKNRVRE